MQLKIRQYTLTVPYAHTYKTVLQPSYGSKPVLPAFYSKILLFLTGAAGLENVTSAYPCQWQLANSDQAENPTVLC